MNQINITPERVAIERNAFEAFYAALWKKQTNKAESVEFLAGVVRSMRDGDQYEQGNDYLNFLWEGWLCRATVQDFLHEASGNEQLFAVLAPCGQGVVFGNEVDARWTATGRGVGSDGFGVPTIGDDFRRTYKGEKLRLVTVQVLEEVLV